MKFRAIMILSAAMAAPLSPSSAALPLAAVDSMVRNGKPTLAPMLKKVTPAVVNISTQGRVQVRENPLLSDPFFRRFFNVPDRPRQRKTQSLGSGVIVDKNKGYILTNNHVIDKAEIITVTLRDGRILEAKLIGTDPDTDVAVIKVKPDDLSDIPMSNSDSLEVGDFAVAIGNPFGLGQTVTSGIISALGRSGLGIEGYEDFIQTDASINPGNSGGALVNLHGELIGINTAIYAPSGGNVGIGFAIPINMARDIMNQLVNNGEVRRGRLGVAIQDLTPDLAKAFGIREGKGAVISQVMDNSPADKAGIKAGDVIVKVNNRKVRNSGDLRNLIGLLRAGTKVKLSVVRNGKRLNKTAMVTAVKRKKMLGKNISPVFNGAEFAILDDKVLAQNSTGIEVSDIKRNSQAWEAGLRKGDIILSVNRHTVSNFKELQKALKRNRRELLLNIQRDGQGLFLLIR